MAAEVAQHIKVIASYDGVGEAQHWTDTEALAWLRGHDGGEMRDFLEKLNTRARVQASKEMTPELQQVINRSKYLLARDPQVLRATMVPGQNGDQFMAVIRSRAEESL